jgi:hypothetical protein
LLRDLRNLNPRFTVRLPMRASATVTYLSKPEVISGADRTCGEGTT